MVCRGPRERVCVADGDRAGWWAVGMAEITLTLYTRDVPACSGGECLVAVVLLLCMLIMDIPQRTRLYPVALDRFRGALFKVSESIAISYYVLPDYCECIKILRDDAQNVCLPPRHPIACLLCERLDEGTGHFPARCCRCWPSSPSL